MSIKIIKVNGRVYDVFFGEGWENWSRIVSGKTYCHVVGGSNRPNQVLKAIHQQIETK